MKPRTRRQLSACAERQDRRPAEARARTGGRSARLLGAAGRGTYTAGLAARARASPAGISTRRPNSERVSDVLRQQAARTPPARPAAPSASSLHREAGAAMKLKQLQALLEDVEPFAKPKVALEQYVTGAPQRCAGSGSQADNTCGSGAHLAASILHTAHALGDVEDRTVLDLGCGCGVLSIAAALMGAGHVVSHARAAPAVSRVAAAGAHRATPRPPAGRCGRGRRRAADSRKQLCRV